MGAHPLKKNKIKNSSIAYLMKNTFSLIIQAQQPKTKIYQWELRHQFILKHTKNLGHAQRGVIWHISPLWDVLWNMQPNIPSLLFHHQVQWLDPATLTFTQPHQHSQRSTKHLQDCNLWINQSRNKRVINKMLQGVYHSMSRNHQS